MLALKKSRGLKFIDTVDAYNNKYLHLLARNVVSTAIWKLYSNDYSGYKWVNDETCHPNFIFEAMSLISRFSGWFERKIKEVLSLLCSEVIHMNNSEQRVEVVRN